MNFYRIIFATVSTLANLLAILLIYLSFISPFDIALDDGSYMSDFQVFLEHLKIVIAIALIASTVSVLAEFFVRRKAFFKISLAKIFFLNSFILLFLFLLVYGYKIFAT